MSSAIPFPPTRWSLVGNAPTGDAGALVERYADAIARYLRLRFPELPAVDFDDLVQEVLMHLLQRPELLAEASPRNGGRFRYFLATVALNQARNVVRSRRRAAARERPMPEDHPAAVEAEVDRAWSAAALAAAWADLRGWASSGDIEAEIPSLLDEHMTTGAPLRELADRHGLSLATCQRRLAKGRTWLRRAIEARIPENERPPGEAQGS